MRTSLDFYKKENGEIVALSCDTKPPVNSKLIKGYDYYNQKWVKDNEGLVRKCLASRTIRIIK